MTRSDSEQMGSVPRKRLRCPFPRGAPSDPRGACTDVTQPGGGGAGARRQQPQGTGRSERTRTPAVDAGSRALHSEALGGERPGQRGREPERALSRSPPLRAPAPVGEGGLVRQAAPTKG